MIVVTTDEVAGRRIERVLGLVRGNTIRARRADSLEGDPTGWRS